MVARLTAVLAIAIAAACAPGAPRPGDAGPAEGPRFEPGPRPEQPPASLLPYPALAGWTLAGRVEVFRPDSLGELAGPGAEDLRRFGCVAAAAAVYRNDRRRDEALRVEIFEMRSPLDAFGVLAQRISASPDPTAIEAPGVLEIREAGVIGPGRLSFLDGPHLVDLVLQGPSPTAGDGEREDTAQEQLTAFARRLALSLPGESALPAELDLLPRERRVRRSERYDPDHLLGLQALGPGVSALYGDPGPRYSVGVSLGLDGPSAARARDALAAHLEESAEVAGLGAGALRGVLPGHGTLLVAVRDAVVAVALIDASRAPPDRGAVAATLAQALEPVAARPRAQDPRPWRRGERAIAAPLEREEGRPAAGSRP